MCKEESEFLALVARRHPRLEILPRLLCPFFSDIQSWHSVKIAVFFIRWPLHRPSHWLARSCLIVPGKCSGSHGPTRTVRCRPAPRRATPLFFKSALTTFRDFSTAQNTMHYLCRCRLHRKYQISEPKSWKTLKCTITGCMRHLIRKCMMCFRNQDTHKASSHDAGGTTRKGSPNVSRKTGQLEMAFSSYCYAGASILGSYPGPTVAQYH